MSPYRTPPPFEPTRADWLLVALCLLVIAGCLAAAILSGAGVL